MTCIFAYAFFYLSIILFDRMTMFLCEALESNLTNLPSSTHIHLGSLPLGVISAPGRANQDPRRDFHRCDVAEKRLF